MNAVKFWSILILVSTLFFCESCKKPTTEGSQNKTSEEVLPSWNDEGAKQQIIEYVSRISEENGAEFVPVADRIACLDNDGTMWVEQPLPSQVYFAADRIRELAEEAQPAWAKEQPFAALLANDGKKMSAFGMHEVIEIVGQVEALTPEENYDKIALDWVKQANHPKLNKHYADLVYQPMLELLDYLREHEFSIYIVSGGGQEFMRAWIPEFYNIPSEHIIGSRFKKEVVSEGEKIALNTTAEFEYNDDKEAKVLSIDQFIGKKPILVCGNSDGDLAMMEYASTDNKYPTFMLYVHHDDADREFDYSTGVLAGALEEGKVVAEDKGWTIVSMKNEWKQVFVK